VGAVLVFRDIGERRRAERQAAYLSSLVESSDDAIVGKSSKGSYRVGMPALNVCMGIEQKRSWVIP